VSVTAELGWTVEAVDFARVPIIGATSVLRRLDDESLRRAMPLLDPAHLAPSASPHHDPARLANIIGETHASVGWAPPTSALQVARGASLVIAGQQPLLMLGPVFTLLKAASAVSLARRLATADAPIIPAFWIAGEDHDLAEVNRCTIGSEKLVIDHAIASAAGPRPPVARVSLEPFRQTIIDFAGAHLADAPHRDWVVSMLEAARYGSYSDLFASLLLQVLGDTGLVLLDPMRLRPLAAPVIARAVGQWGDLQHAFAAGSQEVARRGFNPPVKTLGLFEITAAGRTAISDPAGLDPQRILDDPDRFSPGAALRPVVQDAIIPAVATVAGPTELLYLWQADPLYERLGVRRSSIWPRLSATFIDHRTRRRARRFGLENAAILDAAERFAEIEAGEVDDEQLRAIARLGDELARRIDDLANSAGANPKLLRKARESVRYQSQRVVDRVHQQRLEAAGVGRRNLQQVLDVIYPGGGLQERSLGTMEMLGRYGPAWVRGLLELDPLNLKHHLVDLAAEVTGQGVSP
jgi:uncharacterized protein YllA (UPF0747 family)